MHHPTDSTQTGPRLPAREPREAAHDADRSHGHGYSLGRTLDARDPWGRHEAYEAAAISVGENFANVTRIDAHCHSYASSRPLNRALEVINCPECYSPPEKVFDQAMARGMDLVTITDHDEIRGAMELVERGFQRFIVGEEVSVFFPEDHCLMHVLVWGITPEQHEDIARLGLREDIYQFAAWLREQDLPHACAHPLYVQNGRLTRWHVERCALLFKCFECLNGAHAVGLSDAVSRFVARLTPTAIERLAREHDLRPVWDRAWEKGRTAGSDDHALLNIGRTFTMLHNSVVHPTDARRKIADPHEFFRHAMRGDTETGGLGGHSMLLGHQLATVAAHYYADRMHARRSPTARMIGSKLLRFAGVDAPAPKKRAVAAHQVARKVWLPRKRRRRSLPILKALRSELQPVLDRYPDLYARLQREEWIRGAPVAEHERMADFVQDLTSAVSRAMSPGFMKSLKKRDPTGLIEHALSYAILNAAQIPYLISLFHQNKERNFVERFEHETSPAGSGASVLERPMRISLFTDTIADVNGVCRFIQNVAEMAHKSGRDLQVITSTRLPIPVDYPNIYNFEPVFAGKMPRYETLDFVLPPLMKILRHVDKHQPDVIHISTPGGVGCIGFLVAKMLRVPVLGVYHTDFPAYVDDLFDDHGLTKMTEKFMRGFYKPFSAIFTRSEQYKQSLTRLGLDENRIIRLLPGFDNTLFHPSHREPFVWQKLGFEHLADRVKVLYVGRVSVEKNLPFMTRVWKRVDDECRRRGLKAELLLVGDGPYRKQMAEELRGRNVTFLGFRHGLELSQIYASSDVFAFPSVTDTLGQVVMESQGSGLPCLVTDVGGPQEVVDHGNTGYVLPADSEEAWVAHLVDLIADPEKRKRMGAAGVSYMERFSLTHSFEHFWEVHTQAWHEHLKGLGIRPRGEATADPAPNREGLPLGERAAT